MANRSISRLVATLVCIASLFGFAGPAFAEQRAPFSPAAAPARTDLSAICRDPLMFAVWRRRAPLLAESLGKRCAGLASQAAPLRSRAISPAPWTESVIAQFDYAGGGAPVGSIAEDQAGSLFVALGLGGAYNLGNIVKLSPPSRGQSAWTKTVLHQFSGGSDGGGPTGVSIGRDGIVYGTTFDGGHGCLGFGCGVVFQLTPPPPGRTAWKYRTIYEFSGERGDGTTPNAAPLVAANGVLFGTTYAGGGGTGCPLSYAELNGCGTIYELSPPTTPQGRWSERVLYAFTGYDDGSGPSTSLIADTAGNLYGTTEATVGSGTVFELIAPTGLASAWTIKTLHAFSGLDGYQPVGGLTAYRDKLYGVTFTRGTGCAPNYDCGVVFSLTPPGRGQSDWSEATIHNFNRVDGESPESALIVRCDDLIGTTFGGQQTPAVGSLGLVYELSPTGRASWAERVLYGFTGLNDGIRPGAIVNGRAGVIYGVTRYGAGPSGIGTAFALQGDARCGPR